MSTHTTLPARNSRARAGRTLIAAAAALALTFGPGALAAYAEEPAAPATDAVVADPAPTAPTDAPVSPPPVAQTETSAPEPAPAPAPEPTQPPAPSTEPVPIPLPEPAAPAAPTEEQAAPPAQAPAPEPAAARLQAPDKAPQDDESPAAEPAEETSPTPQARGNGNPKLKITICHATGSTFNPWVVNTPNASGDVSGHAGADHQDGRDIIPPFTYNDGGVTATFPGQNWDAEGQAIYNNGCKRPAPEPEPGEPTMVVAALECVPPATDFPTSITVTIAETEGAGSMSILISSGEWSDSVDVLGDGQYDVPLNGLGDYTISLVVGEETVATDYVIVERCSQEPPGPVSLCHGPAEDGSYEAMEVSAFLAYTEHYEIDSGDIIPPFTVLIEGVMTSIPGQNWDDESREFLERGCLDITPEPRAATVSVTEPECVAADGELPEEIAVQVTGITGEPPFAATITDGTEWSALIEISEAGDYMLPLNGLGDYTVTVTGGEESEILATATFTLERCGVIPPVDPPVDPPVNPPVTPRVTPAVTVTTVANTPRVTAPGLAVSGAAPHGPVLGIAALLGLFGAAALLAGRRRHVS